MDTDGHGLGNMGLREFAQRVNAKRKMDMGFALGAMLVCAAVWLNLSLYVSICGFDWIFFDQRWKRPAQRSRKWMVIRRTNEITMRTTARAVAP